MSLSAILRLMAGIFFILPGVVGLAGAAPSALDCRASGPAGTVAFRFLFDESARQASFIWSAGGGRPSAQYFGEAGSENALEPIFNATSISAGFQHSPMDDPTTYRANIDRTNGGLQFIRYNPIRISQGSCSPSAAPSRQF